MPKQHSVTDAQAQRGRQDRDRPPVWKASPAVALLLRYQTTAWLPVKDSRSGSPVFNPWLTSYVQKLCVLSEPISSWIKGENDIASLTGLL